MITILNIILCDDNNKDMHNISVLIKNIMKKIKTEFKIYEFDDYSSKFDDIVNNKLPFKIYLLDIETPSKSGIDVARQIRKKDVDSVIIFLTAHEELGSVVLKNDLMFLSFINKFDDLDSRLETSLKKAIELLHKRNVIKISDRNITYTININDILYVTKESFERKTIIQTAYAEYKIGMPLKKVVELLDDRFIQTHRACYINLDRKTIVDKVNRIITFDNGMTTNLLSEKFKKEVC